MLILRCRFRWVECQADYLCSCVPTQIQYALADLPETLDETYQRTLRNINNAHWEFAHRLFQFVAVASRPLLVQELAELLAFDFKAGPIPNFDEDCRLEDPVDAVLSTCSNLFVIVDDQNPSRKVIQFSHFSVKEYLTSLRLAEASDIISRRYHISMTPAQTLAAQTCLGILLHLGQDVVTGDNLEKWPLAEYAAKHWADHALFEGVSQNVEDGLKQLFDPRNPHLAVCVWIYDPRIQNRRAERSWLPRLRTSLHYAALWGLHFIVEFLVIECSQDVRLRGFYDKVTPLHLASAHGHVKTVRMLIEHGADVMAQNKDGETPLHLSSQEGQVEVTRTLIERGADLLAQNTDGETPLHLASEPGQAEVARMLIEHGADVAAQNNDWETPLHLASRWGRVEVARILIECGADVTAQNMYGETPLHLALVWVQVELVRMLTECDMDMAAQSRVGEISLYLAASQTGQVEVARMLIERGTDMAAKNEGGETPLHLASRIGQVDVSRMLIERGADVAAQNKDGETPLHLASLSGHVEVARMLIEHGADVAAQTKDLETPLHLASWPNSRSFQLKELGKVSQLLFEQGADINAKNKDGLTPFHLASRSRHLEDSRAQVLLQHGADPGDVSLGVFGSDWDPEMDWDWD